MSLALMDSHPHNGRHIRYLRRAVKELIKAEVADSWKGGGDPADIPQIEQQLVKARKRYELALSYLRT